MSNTVIVTNNEIHDGFPAVIGQSEQLEIGPLLSGQSALYDFQSRMTLHSQSVLKRSDGSEWRPEISITLKNGNLTYGQQLVVCRMSEGAMPGVLTVETPIKTLDPGEEYLAVLYPTEAISIKAA